MQMVTFRNLVCLATVYAAAADPSVTSKDGNLVLAVDQGKTIGYKVSATGEVVSLDSIAPAMRGYTDATQKVLSMGITLGAAQVDTLNKEIATTKAALAECEKGGDKIAAAVKDIVWFGVQQAGRHPMQEPDTVDAFIDGGTMLYIRAFGLDALYNGMAGVPGLFQCGFSIQNSKQQGTMITDKDLGSPVIACALPAAVKSHLAASNDPVTVTVAFTGQFESKISFAGAAGSNKFKASEPTVTDISPVGNFEARAHVPTATGFSFKSGNDYSCRWRLPGTATFYDERATWESSAKVICSKTPRPLAQIFVADPLRTNVEIEVQLLLRNKAVSYAGNPSMFSRPFPLHGGMCVDGHKNGIEVGVDCGVQAGCGKCDAGTAKVEIGGRCDLAADCKDNKHLCIENKCDVANMFNKVAAEGQVFAIANTDSAASLRGKYTATFKFADGKTWSPAPVVASDGRVNFKLPSNAAEVYDADFASASMFSKGVTYTASADGGAIQVAVALAVGGSCEANFMANVEVTIKNADSTSVGQGDWENRAIKVCWHNPAYEVITPKDFYHGDNQAKYGKNMKNIFDYGCDACTDARSESRYVYKCSPGYTMAEYGMRSHCDHKTHKGGDGVFRQVGTPTGYKFWQWSDNCGDPNEATMAALCVSKRAKGKDGVNVQKLTGKPFDAYLRDVRWTN